jgi:hypothetical protein
MRTVTSRSPSVVVAFKRETYVRNPTDTSITLITEAGTRNAGRLAVDNELTRMKYCV